MKRLKIFIILIVIMNIFFILNIKCYAEYNFSETTRNIDNIKVTYSRSYDLLEQALGLNSIFVPYIMIILYVLLQILLMKKYKKDKLSKNLKLCLKIDIIVIMFIWLVNAFISNYAIDISQEIVYITSTMFIQQSFIKAKIANIIINTLILIFGLVISKKMLKNRVEENEKLQNRKMLIILIVLISTLSIIYIVKWKGPLVHVVESDWSFGETIGVRKYNIKIHEGENIKNTDFLVKEIDDEGVLIEYTSGYYEQHPIANLDNSSSKNIDYEYKTEVVQQKMKWNVNYKFYPTSSPEMPLIDGGTDYYVRLKK